MLRLGLLDARRARVSNWMRVKPCALEQAALVAQLHAVRVATISEMPWRAEDETRKNKNVESTYHFAGGAIRPPP